MATPKELMGRFFALVDARRWDELQTLIAPDATAQVGSAPPVPFDPARSLLPLFAAFPDGRQVIHELWDAEGDRVISRGRFEGTHRGPFHGIAPTGAKVSFAILHIDRFREGKLIEHLAHPDLAALLRQIGAR